MQFNEILASLTADEITVPEAWGQGRATFGGLVGALMFQRLIAALPGRLLRALTLSFVGPVAPGAAEIRVEVLRSGKSVTQAECRLLQGGEVQAALLASFGEARSSSLTVAATAAPDYGAPGTGAAMPYLPGLTPEFLQHCDVIWREGGMPFTGADSGIMGGWMRFKQAAGPLSLAHLIALTDIWPPAVIGMLKTLAPASTMTWTFELVGDLAGLQAGDWFQYRAETEFAADGYMHASARVWDAQGRLLVLSRQTAVVFG